MIARPPQVSGPNTSLDELVDALLIGDGASSMSQSCRVSAAALRAPVGRLVALGDAYLRLLDALPLVAVVARPAGPAVALSFAPRRLSLLCFASPYVAAARGGRELRYPIIGGLMARKHGGYLSIGICPEGLCARLWVDVVGYSPLLGLGAPYVLTQVQLHRIVAKDYLRRALDGLGWRPED